MTVGLCDIGNRDPIRSGISCVTVSCAALGLRWHGLWVPLPGMVCRVAGVSSIKSTMVKTKVCINVRTRVLALSLLCGRVRG